MKHGQIIHSMWMTGCAFLEEISRNGAIVYQVVTTISISRSMKKEIPTPSVPEGYRRCTKAERALSITDGSSYN